MRGLWFGSIGLVILMMWLSLMPLYKYPSSTAPFYGYVDAVLWGWFIAGPTLIASGLVLEFHARKNASPKKVEIRQEHR